MKKCSNCRGIGYISVNDGVRLGNRKLQIVGASNNSLFGGKVKIVCPKCYGRGMK